MKFWQLTDADTCTYSYLLADEATNEAVLIDPVLEQFSRDTALIEAEGLTLVATLETHVHADHVTGASALRDRFGSAIIYSARAGAQGADRLVDHGDVIPFGAAGRLEVRATPGHTEGCVTYVDPEHARAFTGDALLIDKTGRTDFQGGSSRTLFRSIHDQIFSLPDHFTLYPGHDYDGRTETTVGDQKRDNARVGGGKTEAEFVSIMDALALPRPRKIDVAVPANLQLGRPAAGGTR